MTRRFMVMLALATPILAYGCGGGGGIAYELDGAKHKLETKSAYYYTSTMTFTSPGAPMKLAASVTAVMAGHELDASSGLRTLSKPLDADGQVRITVNLVGAEGTEGKNATEAAATGEYSATAEKFMKVRSASIHTFSGGKQQEHSLTDGLKGTVKVTKSEGDSFVANVDLTDGKATIQGTFEAKSWKSGSKK